MQEALLVFQISDVLLRLQELEIQLLYVHLQFELFLFLLVDFLLVALYCGGLAENFFVFLVDLLFLAFDQLLKLRRILFQLHQLLAFFVVRLLHAFKFTELRQLFRVLLNLTLCEIYRRPALGEWLGKKTIHNIQCLRLGPQRNQMGALAPSDLWGTRDLVLACSATRRKIE